jgi:hypothetical protein
MWEQGSQARNMGLTTAFFDTELNKTVTLSRLVVVLLTTKLNTHKF